MRVLTISNTVDNVFETNVYDDDTDLVSILINQFITTMADLGM